MSTIKVDSIKSSDGNTDLLTLSNGAVSGVIGGRRNLIINGAMQVAQRGTSATGVTAGAYLTSDRWKDVIGQGTWTSEQSTDSPNGYYYSHKLSCTTAATLHTGTIGFQTRLEGYDVSHLSYGTSDAKALTLSFWIKSNKTGTFQAEFYNLSGVSNHIGITYTIDSADTWEYKTLNVPANTAHTLLNGSQGALMLQLWFDASSSFTSGTYTNSTWVSHNNPDRVTSSITGIGGSTSDYVAITGVQLEVGSVATPFEHRSYGEELALCQRYYQRLGQKAYAGIATLMQINITTQSRGGLQFPTTMRAAPSVSYSDLIITDRVAFDTDITSVSGSVTSITGAYINVGHAASGATYRPVILAVKNSTTGFLSFDAEL